MGGSQSVAVNIALDKPVYVAGEVVRGYADVKVLKDGVVLPDLTVSLSGTTATAVRYTKTTGTGKNKKRVKKTARSNITFLMLQAKVGKIEASQLAAAAHLQAGVDDYAAPICSLLRVLSLLLRRLVFFSRRLLGLLPTRLRLPIHFRQSHSGA